MATALDNVNTAISQVTALIVTVTANPQPTYSVQGVSVPWSEYLSMLTDQLEKLQQSAIFLSGPYELVTMGVS